MTKPLSWVAVRKQDIYCAPACGCSCTWASYEDAVSKAGVLARELGDGWVPDVWENMGWHWAARAPHIRVIPCVFRSKGKARIHSYTAYVNADNPDAIGGQWTGTGNTPQAAVDTVMEELQEEVERVTDALQTLKGVLASQSSRSDAS